MSEPKPIKIKAGTKCDYCGNLAVLVGANKGLKKLHYACKEHSQKASQALQKEAKK